MGLIKAGSITNVKEESISARPCATVIHEIRTGGTIQQVASILFNSKIVNDYLIFDGS